MEYSRDEKRILIQLMLTDLKRAMGYAKGSVKEILRERVKEAEQALVHFDLETKRIDARTVRKMDRIKRIMKSMFDI